MRNEFNQILVLVFNLLILILQQPSMPDSNLAQSLLRKFLFILLIIPFWVGAAATNSQADSLYKGYRASTNPETKFIYLEKLAHQYVSYHPDTSLHYSYLALNLGRQVKSVQKEIEAHILISEAFFTKRLVDSCRRHYHNAIALAVKNKIYASECTTYRRMANFYEALGKRDSALFCLLKAYELSEKSGDKVEKASSLNSLGTFYKRQNNFGKALDYSKKSLAIWEEISKPNTGGILSDIGNIYFQKEKYEEALSYYQAAYKILKANNDALGLGYSLNNIGLVYLMQKNYNEALANFLQSLRSYELAMNKEGISNTNRNLSLVYFELGNYKLSLQYGERGLQIAKEANHKYLVSSCYDVLAQAYDKVGNYKKAYQYQRLFSVYRDSSQSENMVQKVAEIQSRFEMTGKEAENKALRAEKERQEVLLERQKYWAIFIVIVLVMVIAITILIYRGSQQTKKSYAALQEQNKIIETKSMELATLNVKILAQKRQLEEAGQFKDRLLSIVSHDFRSPLNSLQGFLMILSEDELPKEMVRTLSIALLEKVKTTSGFLDNLLSWAQSQLQGYHPSLLNVNLQKAAEDIIALFKPQAEAKGVKVINNISENCEVSADLNMVKLVFRNLISNAIKYSLDGGIVTVSCKKANGEEIITVEDTGKGISIEDQQKLFAQQGFSTLGTANEKGTGLGLMLSKEFVEKNGGRIWVNSTPGKGSTFSFSIPARDIQKQRAGSGASISEN